MRGSSSAHTAQPARHLTPPAYLGWVPRDCASVALGHGVPRRPRSAVASGGRGRRRRPDPLHGSAPGSRPSVSPGHGPRPRRPAELAQDAADLRRAAARRRARPRRRGRLGRHERAGLDDRARRRRRPRGGRGRFRLQRGGSNGACRPGIRRDRRRCRAHRAGRVGAAAARPRLLLPRPHRAGRSRPRPAAHEGLEDRRPRGTRRGRAPAGGARAPRARPGHGRGGGQ